MAFLIGLLLKFGLDPDRARKVALAIIMGAIMAGAVALVLGAVGFVHYVNGLRDKTIEQASTIQMQNANAEATRVNDQVNTNESVAVATQQAQAAIEQKEQDDAASKAPSGGTGPATRAANCVRYRQQHPGAVPPAACR